MKLHPINRRRFLALLGAACVTVPLGVAADAGWIEPDCIKVSRQKIGSGQPTVRLVHFTDLHHKGDRAHTQSVVDTINSLSPDFVCFTGDIMEDAKYLPEALEILSGVKSPMYGVPGNHDYWSRAPFGEIAQCFAATGGAWLVNEQRAVAGGKINLIGIARIGPKHPSPPAVPGTKNILLMHYPAWIKRQDDQKFDLALAGH